MSLKAREYMFRGRRVVASSKRALLLRFGISPTETNQNKIPNGRTIVTHGDTGYYVHKCRCEICTKAGSERSRKYRATHNVKANMDTIRAYVKRPDVNPKYKAHTAVMVAKKRGTLSPKPCEICGSTKKIEAHHDSYAKKNWLKVRWICFVCHRELHNKIRRSK